MIVIAVQIVVAVVALMGPLAFSSQSANRLASYVSPRRCWRTH